MKQPILLGSTSVVSHLPWLRYLEILILMNTEDLVHLGFLPISPTEIISVVKNLPKTESCGSDGISSTMLKSIIDSSAVPLAEAFNEPFF